MSSTEKAIEALSEGRMVLIYDGDEREGEADMVIGASFVKPETVRLMRKDAGGLICAAISKEAAIEIGLPFFTDLLEHSEMRLEKVVCRRTAYGDKPAFSIPINHCEVYTGITDDDRALTLNKLDEVIRERIGDFQKDFYSPGHVFLLISRGLDKRRGHTELAVELGRRAGLHGAMVLCEMLGEGKALSKEEARAYAERNNLVFIEGREIA